MKKILQLSILMLYFLLPLTALAKMSPSYPPEQNPHPPTTSEDRKRVKLAEEAIEAFLKKYPDVIKNAPISSSTSPFTNKSSSCFQDAHCYFADTAFMQEVKSLHEAYGEVTEFKHAHVTPWSFDKFKKSQVQNKPNDPLAIAPSLRQSAEIAMKTPQLQKDEYLIHVYVKWNQETRWYHLDVIVTEDEKGNIYLRHFFTIPMLQNMPEGVVC